MGEKDKQKTKAVKTDSKKGSVKTMKSSKASTSSAHAPVAIVEAEVVERVRRLTSQMRFVDALTLCDEELKRVEETFNRKHQKKHKKWLSKFNAQTQDARDVIATNFVVSFHSMGLGVAQFIGDCMFPRNHTTSVFTRIFRCDVKQLPVVVRGISGSQESEAGWLVKEHKCRKCIPHFARAADLLHGLISSEWKNKLAEAQSGAASTCDEMLIALKTWNWLNYPLHHLQTQQRVVENLLIEIDSLTNKKKSDRPLTLVQHHLLCFSLHQILHKLFVVDDFQALRSIFSHFCHVHRHRMLPSHDDDDTRKVFRQVRDIITFEFTSEAQLDHILYNCLLVCFWHGRHVYSHDVDAQTLLATTCHTYIMRETPCQCTAFAFYIACLALLDATTTTHILKTFLQCDYPNKSVFELALSRFLVEHACDVRASDTSRALKLYSQASAMLEGLAQAQPHNSNVEYEQGVLCYLREDWRQAVVHLEHAYDIDFAHPMVMAFYRANRNVLPVAELREELHRCANTCVYIPLCLVARFYAILSRGRTREGLTKRHARDFARDVRTVNQIPDWVKYCEMKLEPRSSFVVRHTKAMGHLMAAVLFREVRDRSGAKTQLKQVRRLLNNDWPLYEKYMREIKQS